MAVLFGRIVRVAIANLLISDLRIQAKVSRPADGTQTTGFVKIYNLAKDRERQVYERGAQLRVDAGYPSTLATIFTGQAQRIRRKRQIDQAVNRVLHIDLGDETHAKGRLGGVTSRAYAGSESVRNVAIDFAADMGLAARVDAIPSSLRVQDWSASGAITDALTDLLSPHQLGWHEDDGVIVVTQVGAASAAAQTVALSATTGLVGIPEETDEGARFQMLLNPAVKRGSRLLVDSETAAGLWRVVSLDHDADNRGGRFITSVEARPV